MAIPTAPTLTDLCTEGLKKAGYSSPSASQLTRAAGWAEEVKWDLWNLSKNWKSLQTTAYGVTAIGQSRYAFPDDFNHDLTIDILYGDKTGLLQTATEGSATLASTEDIVDDIRGYLLLITSGTGIGVCSQITAYNNTTKVATVTPNFTTTPLIGDGYMVIDTVYPLMQSVIVDRDNLNFPQTQDTPKYYFPVGQAVADSDEVGEFELYPTPDDIYGIQLRYYANLMLIDLTSYLMTTLYRRWRNIFIEGIKVRSLENDRDSRYIDAFKIYKILLNELKATETFGVDLSNLQIHISDYA